MYYDTTRMARLHIDQLHREAAMERSLRRREPVAPVSPLTVGQVMPRAADAWTADVPAAVALSRAPSFPPTVTMAVAADCGDCRDERAA